MGPRRQGSVTVRKAARGARAPHEDYGERRGQASALEQGRPAVAPLHEGIDSPLIAQYAELRAHYPEALLLMRVGDFYEAYGAAAEELAAAVHIVLTSKEAGKRRRVAMAGVPHHQLDHYLARLLRQQRIVAVAEQMEPPAPNRLVRREIVRVMTPGTLLEDNLLAAERNNYVCALAGAAGKMGLAAADISTGAASICVLENDDELAAELDRLAPAEVIVEADADVARCRPLVGERCRVAVFDVDEMASRESERANKFARLQSLAAEDRPAAKAAIELLARYLTHLRLDGASIVRGASLHDARRVMLLDPAARRHLDLVGAGGVNARASLLGVLSKTKTPMGSRMLARWLCAPLLDAAEIRHRHDRVEFLVGKPSVRVALQHALAGIGDIERIVQKAGARRAGPRDMAALRDSLRAAVALAQVMTQAGEAALTQLAAEVNAGINSGDDLLETLEAALADDPAPTVADGGVIRPEFDARLRELVELRTKTRDHLLVLEERTRARTGIKSLKIKYTQAFGYYYEVTRANVHLVPQNFVRRQSLANVERFTDADLQQLEADIVSARVRQIAVERELFERLLQRVDEARGPLLSAAGAAAEVDVYCSLAQAAGERRYVRPQIVEGSVVEIENGRHPIVEVFGGVDFVPNDCRVDVDRRFLIITGPNMGGKSTYLRQAALIAVLAQMGSFVPATRAKLGIVDRLFTRIGAGDDIAAGRSTFYVEMAEMALILRRCTPRSLLLIDEVGRGTGTTDGFAIAQAISEHLLNSDEAMPIVLFATHFHELVRLAEAFGPVVNLHVAVAETRGGPVFSHRVLPGSSSRSYGIAVAKTAGLPEEVVRRAQEIADNMERRSIPAATKRRGRAPASIADGAHEELQLNLGT